MQESVAHPRVRILHTSPGAPAVDVYIGESQKVAGLAYGQLSGYFALAAERQQLRVFASGSHRPEDVLIDDTLQRLRPGTDHTIVVLGQVRDLRAATFEDSTPLPVRGRERLPATEVAKVRILHAAPDAPALDVGVPGDPALFLQVGYGEASPYKEVESGTYDIQVRRAGHEAVVARLPRFDIAGGNRYTLVALGLLDRSPAFALAPIADAFEVCPA